MDETAICDTVFHTGMCLVAPLLIHCPATVPGKTADNDLSTWGLATHVAETWTEFQTLSAVRMQYLTLSLYLSNK